MSGFFSKLFNREPELPVNDLDPHEAAAALLVEAALTDGIYADLESDMVAEILVTSFEMDAARADAVLQKGEELAETATDTHALTKHVKRLPEAERIGVIEGLYRVCFADGETCKFEEAFVRHVASLLHIDDVSRAHARKRAETDAP